MHFSVFLPESNCKPDKLADVGLPGLVDGAFCANAVGPEGINGTMFAWRPDVGVNRGRLSLGYDSNKQSWRKSAARGEDQPCGAYWVGTIKDSPPTPDDLQRAYPYRCVHSLLGDGNEWWFAAERELPYQCKLNDDGSWRFVPQRQFDTFCQVTRDWRKINETVNVGVLPEEAIEFLRMALDVNYRICPEIECELNLWTTADCGTIGKAFYAVIESQGVFR